MSGVKKNLVIVGGGYGGCEAYMSACKRNLNGLQIILISKSNYFYHNVASPRCLVQSSVISDICMSFDNFIKGPNSSFIHGKRSNAITILYFVIEILFNFRKSDFCIKQQNWIYSNKRQQRNVRGELRF